MASFAEVSFTPPHAAEWISDRAGNLQTHIGQAFTFHGSARPHTRMHREWSREAIAEIRELCDILEAKLDAVDAPHVEEAA